IITFDDKGISGHSNHISTFFGAKKFVSSVQDTTESRIIPLYKLTTPRRWIPNLSIEPASNQISEFYRIPSTAPEFFDVRVIISTICQSKELHEVSRKSTCLV
ncbi:6456_t:CDS:2, partial [Acaulospora morrowiae]